MEKSVLRVGESKHLSYRRPSFRPNQVKSAEELKEGATLMWCSITNELIARAAFTVEKGPFRHDVGERETWWIDVVAADTKNQMWGHVVVQKDGKKRAFLSLADMGVCPYKQNGMKPLWNMKHWLEYSDKL